MKLSKEERWNLKMLREFEKTTWFNEISKLNEGDSFGELALLNKTTRAATILCESEICYFALLEQQDYLRILKKIDKYQETQKNEFFK